MTTAAKPAALQIAFVRTPGCDAVRGCPTGVATIDGTHYRVRCEAVGGTERLTFDKCGGGTSVVRFSADGERCSCKGWSFAKRERRCRHLAAADHILRELALEDACRPEDEYDPAERVEEVDSFYSGCVWE